MGVGAKEEDAGLGSSIDRLTSLELEVNQCLMEVKKMDQYAKHQGGNFSIYCFCWQIAKADLLKRSARPPNPFWKGC